MWEYIKHRYSALNGNNRKHTSQDLDGCGILCQQELSSVSCLALLMPKENSWKENSIAGIALGKRQGFGPANFQNRWIYDDLWVSTLTWTVRDGNIFGIWCTLGFWPSGRFECSASADLFHCASVPGQWGHPTWWDGFLTWCGLTRRGIWSHEILGPCMNMYESIMKSERVLLNPNETLTWKVSWWPWKKTRPFLHHRTWYDDTTVQGQASMPYISWRHSWSWPMC